MTIKIGFNTFDWIKTLYTIVRIKIKNNIEILELTIEKYIADKIIRGCSFIESESILGSIICLIIMIIPQNIRSVNAESRSPVNIKYNAKGKYTEPGPKIGKTSESIAKKARTNLYSISTK